MSIREANDEEKIHPLKFRKQKSSKNIFTSSAQWLHKKYIFKREFSSNRRQKTDQIFLSLYFVRIFKYGIGFYLFDKVLCCFPSCTWAKKDIGIKATKYTDIVIAILFFCIFWLSGANEKQNISTVLKGFKAN